MFSWKWTDTICDCLNILSHRLPAGLCAAVFISSFTTALPRGDLEQLQLSAKVYYSHLSGSTQLVDDLCLRLWGELAVICYCMPGVSIPENRTGVGMFKNAFSLYFLVKYLHCGDGDTMSSLNNWWRQVMIPVMLSQ